MHKKQNNANNKKMNTKNLKKIIIGILAGTITGLFGAGGRDDISSSFYLYLKT